jgi:hypothetical protein
VIAIAHHQTAAILIPLGGELGDVGIDLGLQRPGPASAAPASPTISSISDGEPSFRLRSLNRRQGLR